MIRTQIQLTQEQHNRLRELAHNRRISLAEMIRRWVDEKLEEEASADSYEVRLRSALAVCGKYEDREGAKDVALNHDAYLAGAYSE